MSAARLAIMVALLLASSVSGVAEGRSAEFSGREWVLRRTREPEGPGPNMFLDNARTIWVDSAGYLHLRIWSRNGHWYCAEARLTESLGYGAYQVVVEGNLAIADPSAVFGFFTFDHAAPEAHYREIDIEFGRFSDPGHPGAQFALQPFEAAGNHYRFVPPESNIVTTHGFVWTPGEIRFRSARGDYPDLFALSDDDESLIASYTTAGSAVPETGTETVHINFWLHEGVEPSQDLELTVRRFSFSAAGSTR